MIFGKIEYLNLLPFHVFMKRYVSSSQALHSMNYKKGVPSKINKDFLARRVDSAFISSVKVKSTKGVKLGIIARKEVLSVLVIPSKNSKDDNESATSNVLAKVLGVKGEVIIGDKALKYYLSNDDYIDLAKLWEEKYNLPFVFALLSTHNHYEAIDKLSKSFLKKPIKIPRYILNKASKNTGIKPNDVLNYLNYISYNFDKKAQRGYIKFLKCLSKLK